MRRTATLAILFLSTALFAQLPDGDAQWARRAAGSQGGRAAAAPIDAAIAAYKRAVAQQPGSLEAHWKLLRAYRFKGAYVAATAEQKKQVYGEAKVAGEAAVAQAARLLAAKRVDLAKAPEKQVAAAARTIPGVAEVLMWDAVNWGEWALAYGKMAAARQGAADRIRRHATIAYLVDPTLDGGTPPRILGRLHDQTPRIPFITGWASQREAVRFLSESLAADTTNKMTIVFFAEALVGDDAGNKPHAIQILRNAIGSRANPEFVVEQEAAREDAKALLRKLGG